MTTTHKGNKVIIIQGLQYGSEAKGLIAGVVCRREKVEIAVRTGATNAGHTIYHNHQPVKFQQLPVAAVLPGIQLVLGAGSLIDPTILDREVEMVKELTGEDIRKRLIIDYRAGLHLPYHTERSAISGRHHSIGATGKGCSEALVSRIKGRGDPMNPGLFGKSSFAQGYNTEDTAGYLNREFNVGTKILLEGTQGTMLDLYLGPYPYTTHKQTGPAQWMMEAGLSPALPTDIVGVVRSYPIRVAGNSGPMVNEISWPLLARRINAERYPAGPPIVGEWAIREFEGAVIYVEDKYGLRGWGLKQHKIIGSDREVLQKGLSELNAEAIKCLSPDTVEELKKLFEFTTVTKKLRRVAGMDLDGLRYASLLSRPHRIAITFMNYVYPQFWYRTPSFPNDVDKFHFFTRPIIVAAGDAPLDYTGWGPEDEHVNGRL